MTTTEKTRASSSEVVVEVKNLERRFGDFRAVAGISFSVTKGEIFGFLGPNGAGKSTTIRMLCGLLRPTSGSGRVGFDIVRETEKIKTRIGYMSQRFSLYDELTVEENIDFYSGIYRLPREKKKARKDWVLKMAGLAEHRRSRPGELLWRLETAARARLRGVAPNRRFFFSTSQRPAWTRTVAGFFGISSTNWPSRASPFS